MAEIGLADAVASLRAELMQAVLAAADEEYQFPVQGVELEFQVAVTWAAETGGKARFWVLEWGASGSKANETTHTVKVSLGPPVDRNGDVVKVTRRAREKP